MTKLESHSLHLPKVANIGPFGHRKDCKKDLGSGWLIVPDTQRTKRLTRVSHRLRGSLWFL